MTAAASNTGAQQHGGEAPPSADATDGMDEAQEACEPGEVGKVGEANEVRGDGAAHASQQPGIPFFLPAAPGQRLCIYHAPPAGTEVRAALLYVHPFGDEMNRTRRMAAMQARAFAATGVAVLQIDLYGCGDSSGDFAEARWPLWKADLALAHAWLANVTGLPVGLWGLRLGALLALDYARSATRPVAQCILWQPVLNGTTFMTQFLRLRLANALVAGRNAVDGAKSPSAGTPAGANGEPGQGGGTQRLRARLQAGESLEIAGYELAADLAMAIDRLDALHLAPTGASVCWFEVVGDAGRAPGPASQRVAAQWEREGVRLQLHGVPGLPFWATPEISECPALLAATLDATCQTPA